MGTAQSTMYSAAKHFGLSYDSAQDNNNRRLRIKAAIIFTWKMAAKTAYVQLYKVKFLQGKVPFPCQLTASSNAK